MRCRNGVKDDNGQYNVVFFGSYGLNEDGTAKKAPNYSSEQDKVVNELTQRLSVIKGELWYKMSYGLPLFEQNRSQLLFDAFVGKVISEEPDIISILDFKSEVFNRVYSCKMKLLTKYGEIDISV